MWDRGDVLTKSLFQLFQDPRDKRLSTPNSRGGGAGVVPAGFSSTRMQSEENED